MAKLVNKTKNYSEAELIQLFNLTRLPYGETTLMKEWTSAKTTLNEVEQATFDRILRKARRSLEGWQEEELKMKFLAFVLELGGIDDHDEYFTYFERTISATVEGHFLKTKTDLMLAKGILDMPQSPYFHFQEWKKQKDPTGDPVPQLIEAFLIAQEVNKNNKPLYGCTITGKFWDFFVMEQKTYCISESYDCTNPNDLLQIIAMLRKFVEILESRLLN
jgi:hypothetical protein